MDKNKLAAIALLNKDVLVSFVKALTSDNPKADIAKQASRIHGLAGGGRDGT